MPPFLMVRAPELTCRAKPCMITAKEGRTMNLSTFAVLCVLAALVSMAVKYLYDSAKRGRGCSGCTECKWTKDIEKARCELRKQRDA